MFALGRYVLAAIGVTTLAACATQQQSTASWDGLERRDVKGIDQVYVRPNFKFPHYKKVIIDPVQVAFSKNWDQNSTIDPSRRLDAADIQKIKDGLGQLLRERFTRELTAGGYQVTDVPADDTIRLSPDIINLYINAPDKMTAGISRSYTTNAGEMTLDMEVHDSVTGELLARVVDKQRALDTGRLQWTNSVTNSADAERAIDVWARQLRAGLDRVNGPSNP
ncbi:MAG TPA: DUF3313 family protein [Steroidobacteraceae bacterium]|jgi:hypothetical protein